MIIEIYNKTNAGFPVDYVLKRENDTSKVEYYLDEMSPNHGDVIRISLEKNTASYRIAAVMATIKLFTIDGDPRPLINASHMQWRGEWQVVAAHQNPEYTAYEYDFDETGQRGPACPRNVWISWVTGKPSFSNINELVGNIRIQRFNDLCTDKDSATVGSAQSLKSSKVMRIYNVTMSGEKVPLGKIELYDSNIFNLIIE